MILYYHKHKDKNSCLSFLLKIDKTIYNRMVPEIPKNPHNATKIMAQAINI